MYFPFLHNRQSENLCLRELSKENKLTNTTPLICTIFAGDNIDWTDEESINKFIKTKFKALIEEMILKKNEFILIIHDSMDACGITIEFLYSKLKEYSNNDNDFDKYCIFGIYDVNISRLSNSFYDNKEISIIYKDELISVDVDIPKYNILLNDQLALEFMSMKLNNKVIITNAFNKEETNRQYISDDLFSNHALTYKQLGFIGFGDYTILDKDFSSNGGADMSKITVALHLSFIAENQNNIYIRHYICTPETEPEYANKVCNVLNQLRNQITLFYPSLGITELSKLKNTSLGKLKQLSITHHIEFMNNY